MFVRGRKTKYAAVTFGIPFNISIFVVMRYLYLLSLLVINFSLMAQSSLSIVSLQRDVWGNTDANYIQSAGSVENSSSQTLVVKVRMEEIDVVPNTLNYFCWAQCYEPGVLVSPSSLTLAPGERMNTFYGDYVPQGQSGVSTIKYCFFNVDNETDSVCGIVRFSASPLGVGNGLTSDKAAISEAYPNPASSELSFSYSTGNGLGSVEIFSLLGAKVRSIKLNQPMGKMKLNVETLPAGMYFCKLTVNGQNIQTRKFLVTK